MSLKSQFFAAFASCPRPTATQVLRPAVSHDNDRLRQYLATKTATELSASEIRTEVEGNLSLLSPEAFRYFLPAFMHASLEAYDSVSVFAAELIGALTEPARTDIVEAFDRAAQTPPGLGLMDAAELRRKQLEWFDAGIPTAIFHERFDNLTPAEGAAILAFLVAFQAAHGADFPFGELEVAIDRTWGRFRPA
jgi:hypothetical protein